MTETTGWPHRWFGVWREYGPAYQDCPSIHAFVDRALTASYDKAGLRRYLTSAPIVASTSRASFPCPFTGKRTEGSISFRTDGHWLWLDDLADYIDLYGVALPPAFLRDIETNNYLPPPAVESGTLARLEWPPVKSAI